MSNTIEVCSAVHGIAPRSDDLLRAGTDLERGRITPETYEALVATETDDWLALQADEGVTFREDGKLTWADHLRPIVKATDGFAEDIDAAPVTRWFETNTFYRQPTIEDSLEANNDQIDQLFAGKGYVSLLAPDTFTQLCASELDEADTAQNVHSLYKQLFDRAVSSGVERITLTEYAATDFVRSVQSPPIEGVVALANTFPGLAISYLQLGNAHKVGTIPLVCPPNLGLEVSETAQRNIGIASTYGFGSSKTQLPKERWQAVIVGDSTVLRTPELPSPQTILQSRIERLVLTHTTDLQLLPLPFAHEKIKQLGEITSQLQEQLGAL